MKKLISYKDPDQFKEDISDFNTFTKASVFFDNENFLITKYTPLSSSVLMILEDSKGNELHVENCNCGYGGTGPNNTVRLLQNIGVKTDISEIKKLVFNHNALQFSIEDNLILYSSVDSSSYFCTFEDSNNSEIYLDGNVYIDITKRKVIFINPQYHYFIAFLNFIKRIQVSEFCYYIGNNSPLANYLNIESIIDSRFNFKKPDLIGVEHVNLLLTNKDIEISCLIDRNYEIQVIDAIYLALKNENLFETEQYEISIKKKNRFKVLFQEIFPKRNKNNVLTDEITLISGDKK